MSKQTETTTSERQDDTRRPVAYLSYLPARERGNGSTIGPVFATRNDACKSLIVESLPLRLIQDMQRGEVGSFFIWDRKP